MSNKTIPWSRGGIFFIDLQKCLFCAFEIRTFIYSFCLKKDEII